MVLQPPPAVHMAHDNSSPPHYSAPNEQAIEPVPSYNDLSHNFPTHTSTTRSPSTAKRAPPEALSNDLEANTPTTLRVPPNSINITPHVLHPRGIRPTCCSRVCAGIGLIIIVVVIVLLATGAFLEDHDADEGSGLRGNEGIVFRRGG